MVPEPGQEHLAPRLVCAPPSDWPSSFLRVFCCFWLHPSCGLWHELSPVCHSWSSRGCEIDLASQRSWHCTWERCEPTGHISVPRMLWVTPRGSPHQLPSLPGTHIPPTGPPLPPLNPLWASVVSEMSCAALCTHLLVCLDCCVCRLCAEAYVARDASACQAPPPVPCSVAAGGPFSSPAPA